MSTNTKALALAAGISVLAGAGLVIGAMGMQRHTEQQAQEESAYATVYAAASDLCIMHIDGVLRQASSSDHMDALDLALDAARADGAEDNTLHDALWAGLITATSVNCGQGQHGYVAPTDAEVDAVADQVLAAVQS